MIFVPKNLMFFVKLGNTVIFITDAIKWLSEEEENSTQLTTSYTLLSSNGMEIFT